jgi:hypothetical protein
MVDWSIGPTVACNASSSVTSTTREFQKTIASETEADLRVMARAKTWTVEEANAALPRVRALLERIRELVAGARREREAAADRVEGNGHTPAGRAAGELQAAIEELAENGIVLRDLDAGLVDFPALLADGREYLLCWLPDEPEIAWWHWPDTGFAGRRPLTDPPE